MQTPEPLIKDIVLIGGGHSHAIVLEMWGMNPVGGIRITLITDTSHTPYSGMLPGHVAGFYDFEECHIDLRRLCQFAGVQLYRDKAIGLDLENQRVLCANRPPVAFDLLSIDIGSTPAKISAIGATEYAIPAKPVPQFLAAWNQFLDEIQRNPKLYQIGIVGGGAGGVELAFTMQRRFTQLNLAHPIEIHLFHRSTSLIGTRNTYISKQVERLLRQKGIQLHLEEEVQQVTPTSVICKSGFSVECHPVYWVTQASAPEWLKASGLAIDEQGFIAVNHYLQSLSHPQIFAAGDVATMVDHPRPKAGVFAVRQGKPLFTNLKQALAEQPLKPYYPQKRFLGLIGTGDESAIASWGPFGLGPSKILWQWKDRIDRQFMQRFSELPEMRPTATPPQTSPPLYCAGCGSKVGSSTLEDTLNRVKAEFHLTSHPDILLGLDAPDDAAVIQVPSGKLMVQTIDYFQSLISDPFILGQITANHCLGDILAMGATPHSVLALATLPHGTAAIVSETLYQLLSGAIKILSQTQTPLIGGHTTEGTALAFGLSCNGLALPETLLKKSGMQSGLVLILTKPLGTGTLFAADMRYQAKGQWIDAAVASMLHPNHQAAATLIQHGATACTDITGFGLLGHLLEMVKASQVSVELNLSAIPVLEGATETLQQGLFSSLHPQNYQAAYSIQNLGKVEGYPLFPVLFDPQTAGGLLATLPESQASACVTTLKHQGYPQTCVIGRVFPVVAEKQPITISL